MVPEQAAGSTAGVEGGGGAVRRRAHSSVSRGGC